MQVHNYKVDDISELSALYESISNQYSLANVNVKSFCLHTVQCVL